MKLKKIKLKKKQPSNMSKAEARPKKTSKIMIGFIIITTLFFFVLGYMIFGLLVALAFTVLYLLMIWLVRTIDRYPIGTKKRKRAKNIFLIMYDRRRIYGL